MGFCCVATKENNNMTFTSKLIERAVSEIAKLPGIGKKTALRLVFFLLKESEGQTEQLAESLLKLRREIKYCKRCFNISDSSLCIICQMHSRDQSLICVVETYSDLIAIENTAQYNGLYHVLGGRISPIEGIGPTDIRVKELLERVATEEVKEIIMALSATMDADTTIFYLTKKLEAHQVKITTIARGVPVGNEIEYTDELTLGRSISARINYR